MKNYSGSIVNRCFVIITVCIFSFCKKSVQSAPLIISPVTDTTYQLVWADEFNGNSIDSSLWNFETGGNGWGNHEQEYYQQQNASIENGNLIITANKETVGTNGYTSARITTQGKKEFQYGKIEARIKIPVGMGLWPAFWMLGSTVKTAGWPGCGETDIMEHINADSLIYGTAHWNNNGHVQSGDTIVSSPSAYHIYSVEWNADSITWYVDSIKYHTVDITANSTDEFHQPFFIILNLAVGGDWPGQVIDDKLIPAKMYVDWVRVYQKQ